MDPLVFCLGRGPSPGHPFVASKVALYLISLFPMAVRVRDALAVCMLPGNGTNNSGGGCVYSGFLSTRVNGIFAL